MFTLRTLREGKWPLLILAILTGLGWLWCWPAFLISFGLLLFTLWFFRDPTRSIPPDPRAIVAPADGKVVEITPGADGTMVAIFLSVFDVHTQRAPMAGTITAVSYHPGKFFDVRHPKASAENEHRLLVITGADGYRVRVRQIAGLIARRIVGWKHEGDRVEKGEHIGMIRFGSRVELTVPTGTEITVQVGATAKGGETIVARRP